MEESPIVEMEPAARREVLTVLQTLQKDQYDKWIEAKKLVEDAKADIGRAKAVAEEELKRKAQTLIEQAKEELVAIKEQARREGRDEGLAKAATVAAEWQKIAATLADFARDYQANVARCAIDFAVYALGRHLLDDPSFFDRYFDEWLQNFRGDNRCRGLSVHPEAVDRVRAVLQRFPSPLQTLPVQGNSNLHPGDIEMDLGAGQGAEFKLRATLAQIAIS